MNRAIIALLLCVFAMGCATSLETDPVPSTYRNESQVYFVENHGEDKRRMDQMIAARLEHWGVQTSSGYQADRPEEFDVLVVYEDRWQWDMSTYLIDLRIELRDAKTNAPVATGHSYQTSLARKSPEEVVARVIDGMMTEAATPR